MKYINQHEDKWQIKINGIIKLKNSNQESIYQVTDDIIKTIEEDYQEALKDVNNKNQQLIILGMILASRTFKILLDTYKLVDITTINETLKEMVEIWLEPCDPKVQEISNITAGTYQDCIDLLQETYNQRYDK